MNLNINNLNKNVIGEIKNKHTGVVDALNIFVFYAKYFPDDLKYHFSVLLHI